MSNLEKTLVIIKPDAIFNNHEAKIIARLMTSYEDMSVKDVRKLSIKRDIAEKHYEEHVGKLFFDRACNLLCEGPLVMIIVEGNNAIDRMLTFKKEIRTLYAENESRNCIHTSDSVESATREIELWTSIPIQILNL